MQKLNKFILNHTVFIKIFIWLLCFIPLGVIVYGGFTDNLSANPVDYVTKLTGKYGLIFLCVTLAITPARQLLKLNSLIRFRRLLGLFSFFYILLHFIVWFWLDNNLDFSAMMADTIKRPFIALGMLGFILLFILAITSFNKAIRLLGRNWQRLHYSIYIVAILSIGHYYLIKASKNNLSEIYLYGSIIGVLLIYRIIKKKLSS